ncbi:MAG: hypothetical protein KA586_00825 [Candidatus Promineofilum sp.]|nr:hypothetical protein [Promineifilum sp.]
MDITTPSPEIPPSGNNVRKFLLPGLFFLLLVLIVNLPLVIHLNSHVVGRPFDDSFEVLWQLVSAKKAVFQTGANPFYTPNVYFPKGWYTASGAQPTWYFLLLSPFTALLGPIVTYNLTLLATFVLGGLGMYWLVETKTSRVGAGLLAGCVYIAAPVFTLRLGGHLQVLIGMMFLPYAAASLLRLISVPRPISWKWMILSGTFLAATIISQWYFLFVATLPLLGLGLLAPSEANWRDRFIRLFGVFGITFLLIAPFALLTWHARREMLPDGGKFTVADSEQLGFSSDYLFSPNPLHPLWRNQTSTVFPIRGEWDVVSLGYAAMIAAIIGLVTTPWRKTRPFIIMGLISIVLGLGLTLRWRGERVLITAPAWVSSIISPLIEGIPLPHGQIPIVLPGMLLYHWLPFYSSLRVWARFGVPLMLVVAVLAGFGTAWLLGKERWGTAIAIALGGLIIFEGLIIPYPDFTAVSVNDRLVDEWLAGQPEGTALIEYPRPWIDKLAMYSQSRHGQPIVNGYMSFQPSHLAVVEAQLGSWPTPAAIPILREWGVDLVLVSAIPDNDDFATKVWPSILAMDELCLLKSFPDAFEFSGFEETHVFAIIGEDEPCPPGSE